jgi:hypothetical protein
MNSLRAPLASSFLSNPLSAIAGKRWLLLICLLIFASNAARAQEEAAVSPSSETKEARRAVSATGPITGQVVSEDGRPLADAVIFLNRIFARVPGPPLTATTDSEGRFRSASLDPGLYVVNAMLPGYSLPEVPTDANDFRYRRPGDFVNITLVKGGVITGTVRDANGDPVVAVMVRATRVRDAAGRSSTVRFANFSPEKMTDDRGIYRIYGLPPGAYVVSAGGGQRNFGGVNAYEGDAPTFFPSSTRDTAAEVPVRSGEEATGIDIRYRGERGRTVSGTVTGFIDTGMNSGVPIILRQTGGSGYQATTFVLAGARPGFSFSGVSDGEYEVMAQQWGSGDSAASVPRRITVKGADVTGIELTLAPLASIAGSATFEAAPKEPCAEGRPALLTETLINARRDEKNLADDSSRTQFFSASGGIPEEKGEFIIRNLLPGDYRVLAQLPADNLYVRSIVLPRAATPQPTAPAKAAPTKGVTAPTASTATNSVVTLKAGVRVTGVSVLIAQDAAGLRGRVAAGMAEGAEGGPLPANLKVYLVPVERERAEDVLRYSEVSVGSDGTFALRNLAPGRYWLIARPAAENESPERLARPLSWSAESRARLRRDAETANTTIELQPCQRVNDYVLRYVAAK